MVDLAAGRPLSSRVRLTDEQSQLVYRHGLVGIAHEQARFALTKELVGSWTRLQVRQHSMRATLADLLIQLDDAGLRATVLKGPYVAETIYQRASERTYTDLDLLVEADQLDRAIEIIQSHPACRGIPPKRPRADKRDVVMRSAGGIGFSLDLHWGLFSYSQLRGAAQRAMAEAWEGARRINAPFGPIWDLPQEATLAFLCTHALLDHRFRLILLRDLKEMALKGIDWDRFEGFVKRHGLASVAFVPLLMAAEVVQAPVPHDVLDRLRLDYPAVRAAERFLKKADIVRFNGHRPSPLNLAVMLLHDDPVIRRRLIRRAPLAFLGWRRRVRETANPAGERIGPAITVVVTSNRRRGAEVFGARLVEGLEAKGWVATLAALRADSEEGVPIVGLSGRDRRNLRFNPGLVLDLRRFIGRNRPDVILANGGATLRYLVMARLLIRRRPALAYASIGEPAYWVRGPIHRQLQRVLLAQCDRILAVSDATARQLVEVLGVPPRKIIVAPTGIPEEFFQVESEPRGDGETHILVLGNLSDEKDPLAALEIAEIAQQQTPLRIRFVGEGPLAPNLRASATSSVVADRFESLGQVADVKPHLGWADVLLLTSKTEGLPGAVLEASAARVPTVAFSVGGVGEAIEDGVTGFLINGRSRLEAAAKILYLAENPEIRGSMGEAARKRVYRDFSLDKAVDLYSRELMTLTRVQDS